MKIRAFNQKGITFCKNKIESCRVSGIWDFAEESLLEDDLSRQVSDSEVELQNFENRLDLAKYLYDKIHSLLGNLPPPEERGMWTWLAMFYFTAICPQKGKKYIPGAWFRWIPESEDYKRYYRHLVSGPVMIYQTFRENPQKAVAVLSTSPGNPGEIVEQLASRQSIITNHTIMEVASRLYVDSSNKQKRGAASKKNGAARRFTEVISQFDLTWDLYAMKPDTLLKMLPSEFDKFRN